ncbi:MAG TPA: MarR family transcriptional regulator [Acidimicrobiales bacterium]|nr:MarR family transcriptional regulator [Acidimicrobiales bacterium]
MTVKAHALVDQGAAYGAARLAKQIEVALSCGSVHAAHDIVLSVPQYRLLAYLAGEPERARQLASLLAVSPPTLTALVDGLVSKGLVDRVSDDNDRRIVRHQLTDLGTVVLEEATADINGRLVMLADHLTEAEARTALEGLALWNKAMEHAHKEHVQAKRAGR